MSDWDAPVARMAVKRRSVRKVAIAAVSGVLLAGGATAAVLALTEGDHNPSSPTKAHVLPTTTAAKPASKPKHEPKAKPAPVLNETIYGHLDSVGTPRNDGYGMTTPVTVTLINPSHHRTPGVELALDTTFPDGSTVVNSGWTVVVPEVSGRGCSVDGDGTDGYLECGGLDPGEHRVVTFSYAKQGGRDSATELQVDSPDDQNFGMGNRVFWHESGPYVATAPGD